MNAITGISAPLHSKWFGAQRARYEMS